MTAEEFREQHQPIRIPYSYNKAVSVSDKVVFALAAVGEGTADSVIRHLEELNPAVDHRPLIATTRELLTALYNNGHIAGHEENGELVYSLHKITRQMTAQ